MIQRIQSVYLFLISILSMMLFFFPFQKNVIELSEIRAVGLSIFEKENNILFVASILNLIIIVDTAIVIFSYKQRKLQIMLCHYLSVMNGLLLVLMYYGAAQVRGLPTYQLSYIIPILNIVLSQVARYYIRKDEELVRSADRIR